MLSKQSCEAVMAAIDRLDRESKNLHTAARLKRESAGFLTKEAEDLDEEAEAMEAESTALAAVR